jgi:hypothetical protein
MPDPNCAHCNGAQHCFQQARTQRLNPYEAIRTALLTGVAVGSTDLADAPACDECAQALDIIRAGIARGAEMLGDEVRPKRTLAERSQGAAGEE